MYPQEGTRDKALYDYLIGKMATSGGVAPTIRQVIKDRVGQNTDIGAMTSTSIVNYHLDKLVKMGLIETGGRRGVRLVGAHYVIPENHIWCREIADYGLILIDHTLTNDGTILAAVSADAPQSHVKYQGVESTLRVIRAIENTQSVMNVPHDNIAFVTDNQDVAAIAASAGCGVFSSGQFVEAYEEEME